MNTLIGLAAVGGMGATVWAVERRLRGRQGQWARWCREIERKGRW